MSDVLVEFDTEVRAAYIRLSDARVSRTVSMGDFLSVDLDRAGNVVGIEAIGGEPSEDLLAELVSRFDVGPDVKQLLFHGELPF